MNRENEKVKVGALFPALFVVLFTALWYWQSPGYRLTPGDIDQYLGRMEAGLQMEQREKDEFLTRLRQWAEHDDGKPVHMLNLIRFHDPMPPVPGHPEFKGSAEEANAHYERAIRPLLAARGVYPVFASTPHDLGPELENKSNLIGFSPAMDDWDRVMLVRYPNRRAFLDMASDPTYLKMAPFKLAAIDLGFVPLNKNYQLPDPRWIVALSWLVLFVGVPALRKIMIK
jgi:hypothetical protein